MLDFQRHDYADACTGCLAQFVVSASAATAECIGTYDSTCTCYQMPIVELRTAEPYPIETNLQYIEAAPKQTKMFWEQTSEFKIKPWKQFLFVFLNEFWLTAANHCPMWLTHQIIIRSSFSVFSKKPSLLKMNCPKLLDGKPGSGLGFLPSSLNIGKLWPSDLALLQQRRLFNIIGTSSAFDNKRFRFQKNLHCLRQQVSYAWRILEAHGFINL